MCFAYNIPVFSVDQLDGLDASVWSTIAQHGRPIDVYSPDVQEVIDVTDGRLRNLYDAFDRDFDGRLSKPELLQGLAQQGFTNLEGTREFELLWETCEKITTNREGPGGAESEEEGEGLGPELAGARRGVSSGQLSARKGRGGRKDENRITFAAFKRIVQRLKMELLFLPPMAMRQKQLATKDRIEERGEHGRFTQSRSPLPFGRAAGEMAPTTEQGGGAEGLPAEGLEEGIKNGLSTLAGSAPKLHSGAGVGDESRGLHVGSELSIAVGGFPDGRITPALYPDYGTTCPAYFLVDEDEEGENGGRKNSTGQGRMEVVKFSSLDYNEKTYSAEIPVADTYAFFTTHRDPKDFMMRWLHLEGLDRLTILRFAIKYSLHPLCVEDALKLEDQQPKVNKYGCHYFIVMPFFRLTRESREALKTLRQQRRRYSSIIKSTAEAAALLAHGATGQRERGGLQGSGQASPNDRRHKGKESWSDFHFRVEWSKLCIFMAGAPSYDTLISLHGKWETFNSETDEMLRGEEGPGGKKGAGEEWKGMGSRTESSASMAKGGNSSFMGGSASTHGLRFRRGGGREAGDLDSGEDGLIKDDSMAASHYEHHVRYGWDGQESGSTSPYSGVGGANSSFSQGHIFERLVTALKVDYSTLRQGNSKHLLYRILDEVVDFLIPIAQAYRTRVRLFQAQLHRNESTFKKEHMRLVLGMKSELQRLQRRIRPMTAVVRHLMDDEQIGQDMKVYLEDVLDHVVRGLEEIGGCIEMCDSTKEEFKSLRDQRTNEVLYTLTVVTTMFVPLQFLTGVYGMNFMNKEGEPTMPELLWPRGYLFFWCMAATLFSVSWYFFRRHLSYL